MTSPKLILIATVASIATFAPANAQQSPMPDDIAWKLVEIGRVVDPPKTAALYAPLQQREPYAGVKVEREIAYGPTTFNRLDVFMPETAGGALPVLIFVHGGGFVAGNRRGANASPFYDNIMLWAVKNGFVGVNIDYRLAPLAPWPAGAEDLGDAVQWVADNIGARGGDPARIHLMGHSAGAAHVASYVSHPEFYKVKGSGLKGAIMVSGLYDLTSWMPSAGAPAYFGWDRSLYEERSALKGMIATSIPLLVTAAELDPQQFVDQVNLVKDALCKGPHGCARTLILPQHSHMSEVYAINTPDTRLMDQILEFVKTGE